MFFSFLVLNFVPLVSYPFLSPGPVTTYWVLPVTHGLPITTMEEDPELVRDAGANFKSTEFHPNENNVTVTTHWIEEGLLRYTGEKWIRKEKIGRGGQGSVFLEWLHDDESTRRAVKRIDIADEDVKRKYYIRELETLMKFSQEGVSEWQDLDT